MNEIEKETTIVADNGVQKNYFGLHAPVSKFQ